MTEFLDFATDRLKSSPTILDFIELFPERKYLLEEFASENKTSLDDAFSDGNIVRWQCSNCGMSFSQSVISRLKLPVRIKCQHVGSREVNKETVLKGPLLSEASSKILNSFDYDLNFPLKPEDFTFKSQSKIWWSFTNCGHSRYMLIGNRTIKDQGCGELSCKTKKLVNSRFFNLSFEQTIAVDAKLLKMWSPSNKYEPSNISRFTNKSYFWICECGKEWESSTPKQEYNYFACNECSSKLLNHKLLLDRVNKAGGPLWQTHPDIWNDTDSLRNEEDKIDADLIYYGLESKKIWWKCEDCKQSYKMSPSQRNRGGKCNSDFCIKGRIGEKAKDRAWTRLGSMVKAHLELIEEFDYAKNSKGPEEIRANSKEDVWWICKEYGHSWEQSVYSRVRYKNDCMICSKGSSISRLEYDVFEAILAKVPDLKCVRNIRSLARSDGYKFELDLYFPELSKGIEVNGNYWHSDERIKSRSKGSWLNAEQYHRSKLNSFSDVGIDIVFLWEYEWVMSREEILDELITFLKTGEKTKKLLILKHSETNCYKPVSES